MIVVILCVLFGLVTTVIALSLFLRYVVLPVLLAAGVLYALNKCVFSKALRW